jgi:hypothetical protein
MRVTSHPSLLYPGTLHAVMLGVAAGHRRDADHCSFSRKGESWELKDKAEEPTPVRNRKFFSA